MTTKELIQQYVTAHADNRWMDASELEALLTEFAEKLKAKQVATIKCEKKSPITGGEMQLMQERTSVKFRGKEVSFVKKYYHCVDSGQDFTDTELDDDNMWAIFRAYCEKMGYHSFKDIVLITDIVTVRDAGLSWKDIERIITIENDMIAQYDRAMLDQMPEEEYYKEILKRFNETKV